MVFHLIFMTVDEWILLVEDSQCQHHLDSRANADAYANARTKGSYDAGTNAVSNFASRNKSF